VGSYASRQNYSYLQQGIIARAEKFFYPLCWPTTWVTLEGIF
jgi:hypothetical protein